LALIVSKLRQTPISKVRTSSAHSSARFTTPSTARRRPQLSTARLIHSLPPFHTLSLLLEGIPSSSNFHTTFFIFLKTMPHQTTVTRALSPYQQQSPYPHSPSTSSTTSAWKAVFSRFGGSNGKKNAGNPTTVVSLTNGHVHSSTSNGVSIIKGFISGTSRNGNSNSQGLHLNIDTHLGGIGASPGAGGLSGPVTAPVHISATPGARSTKSKSRSSNHLPLTPASTAAATDERDYFQFNNNSYDNTSSSPTRTRSSDLESPPSPPPTAFRHPSSTQNKTKFPSYPRSNNTSRSPSRSGSYQNLRMAATSNASEVSIPSHSQPVTRSPTKSRSYKILSRSPSKLQPSNSSNHQQPQTASSSQHSFLLPATPPSPEHAADADEVDDLRTPVQRQSSNAAARFIRRVASAPNAKNLFSLNSSRSMGGGLSTRNGLLAAPMEDHHHPVILHSVSASGASSLETSDSSRSSKGDALSAAPPMRSTRTQPLSPHTPIYEGFGNGGRMTRSSRALSLVSVRPKKDKSKKTKKSAEEPPQRAPFRRTYSSNSIKVRSVRAGTSPVDTAADNNTHNRSKLALAASKRLNCSVAETSEKSISFVKRGPPSSLP
jgi:hypothetical protein